MTSVRDWRRGVHLGLALLVAGAALLVAGCPNAPSPPATTGAVTGTVTNSLTDAALADVAVTSDPAFPAAVTTDASGEFSVELEPGVYTLTFAREKYTASSRLVVVAAGGTSDVAVELAPVAPVIVTASLAGTPAPGGTVTANVNVEVFDGRTVQSYAWAQSNSVPVVLANANTASASVTLPALDVYKEELATILQEPPISEDELPPNIPLPEEDRTFGLPNRFMVAGINPFAIEEAGLINLEVAVVTSSGTFTAELPVHTVLPFKPATGVQDVPIGIPVLLHGKEQDSYAWTLTRPAGSSATLTDADTRNPYFTPDVTGLYTITVDDETVTPAVEVELQIYGGTWQGAITGKDGAGLPEADNCTICHNPGGFADGNQFAEWAATGHAAIFTDQINTGDHYSTSCLSCHTVGFDTDVSNGGIDDASDWDDFVAADLFHHVTTSNWDRVLSDFPQTALRANIQCENCHGPQQGGAHTKGEVRYSLSSDVCGSCHGEPARHGRFQQWQLSSHASYDLALEEGMDGNCGRCHSANGFIAWTQIINDDDPATDATDTVTVTWDENTVHPATCVACHDPHNVGATTGETTDAPMRVEGDTPMLLAGFSVKGVGKAAVCMLCHNSRRSPRDDEISAGWGDAEWTTEGPRAPHHSVQADVVVGTNAFLVNTGVRGGHSFIENVCVNCHMVNTPPPELLSYELGGTNHTFFAANNICSDCHGPGFVATGIQDGFDATLDHLKSLIEAYILQLFEAQFDAGNKITFVEADAPADQATATATADIESIEFTYSHGTHALNITFADGTELINVAVGSTADGSGVKIYDAGDTYLGHLFTQGVYAANATAHTEFLKACWNYQLALFDGSKGVHNPTFIFTILDGSVSAIEELLP